MVVNYFVKERQKIKQQLLNFLQSNQTVPFKQALAVFSIRTGYRVDTLKKYVQELKDANLIKIEIDENDNKD